MYALDDWWVWDFWVVRAAAEWHLFHLQSPRSTHPDDRHWNASVGHAVSDDLVHWERVGTALEAGPAGAWDETAIWTGSTIAHDDGGWLMAYTGVSRIDGVATERIGVAWSDDLHAWRKDDANPVLVSNPDVFEAPGTTSWQHGWRDPWLHRTDDGGYGMLLTARLNGGDDPFRRGVIARSTSSDGCSWRTLETLTGTGGVFAQLEVPHVVEVDGQQHLVFCTTTDRPWVRTTGEVPIEPGVTGTATMIAAADGSFSAVEFLDAVPTGSIDSVGRYAGRVVETDGGLRYIAFEDSGPDGFIGRISDPIVVSVNGAGRLQLVEDSP